MELSLKISGKHIAITAAVIAVAVGTGLGYTSYNNRRQSEVAMAEFNQQVAAFDKEFSARTNEMKDLARVGESDAATAAADESATAASAAANEAAAAAQAAGTDTKN
jgi:hypothetical protein